MIKFLLQLFSSRGDLQVLGPRPRLMQEGPTASPRIGTFRAFGVRRLGFRGLT